MKNEVKKALYRERPLATLKSSVDGSYVYEARTTLGMHTFRVPVTDMGDTKFGETLHAQFLIRWLV